MKQKQNSPKESNHLHVEPPPLAFVCFVRLLWPILVWVYFVVVRLYSSHTHMHTCKLNTIPMQNFLASSRALNMMIS